MVEDNEVELERLDQVLELLKDDPKAELEKIGEWEITPDPELVEASRVHIA